MIYKDGQDTVNARFRPALCAAGTGRSGGHARAAAAPQAFGRIQAQRRPDDEEAQHALGRERFMEDPYADQELARGGDVLQ
ncbi:hypothetical protein D3C72_2317280 [compost metagenome]